jgi:hypothetical protein
MGWWTAWWVFISSLVLVLWAGRSLAKTLAAASGGSWGLPPRSSRASVATAVSVSAIIFAGLIAVSIFRQVRDEGGFVVGAWSISASIGMYAIAMFAVMLTLPRPVSDPGALLPGALVFGVVNAAVQAFMQLYIPGRIERDQDRLGELAVTVAVLGNFFIIGRLITACLSLNSVTYRRWGSLSALVFRLPGFASAARRSHSLRSFFSLELVEREGRKPTVVSAARLDPMLGGVDDDSRGDGDQREVEHDLQHDGDAAHLAGGDDVAEADGRQRDDGEVHGVDLGVEAVELPLPAVEREVDGAEADDGEHEHQHDPFGSDHGRTLGPLDGTQALDREGDH